MRYIKSKKELKNILNISWKAVLILMIAILGCKVLMKPEKNTVDAFSPITGKIVVVDAGHGGIDAGVVGKITNVREDELNLKVSILLKEYLEKSGAKVIMTRKTKDGLYDSTDTAHSKKDTDMRKRKEIISKSNCDAAISIHMNKYPNSMYYGAQTFFQRGSENGKKLADCIQGQMIQTLDKNNKRVALSGDYFILKCTSSPSVIVECGFMSNSDEEKLLVQPEYQKKVAWSIYTGIINYFATN